MLKCMHVLGCSQAFLKAKGVEFFSKSRWCGSVRWKYVYEDKKNGGGILELLDISMKIQGRENTQSALL